MWLSRIYLEKCVAFSTDYWYHSKYWDAAKRGCSETPSDPMGPIWILIFTIVISRWLIAQQAEYPQWLFNKFNKLLDDIYVFRYSDHLQTTKVAQWWTNMSESIVMALYQSFVWYYAITDSHHKTKRSQSFGKMLRTLSISMLRNDRWVESKRFRLVSNSASQRKMTRLRRSVPKVHGKPVSTLSISENHPESMSRQLQQSQTVNNIKIKKHIYSSNNVIMSWLNLIHKCLKVDTKYSYQDH